MSEPPWLSVARGEAPLLLSLPHTGTEIPADIAGRLASEWLARKDCDWWVDRLYAFAAGLGATVVRTAVSRAVVDVNRDPSGASLYPGRATTALCPTTTFDGEPLYRPGEEPDADEVAARRRRFFDPFHAALEAEVARLSARFPAVVVFDCHSIRSVVPRLFEGTLPHLNIGTNDGAACDPALTAAVEAACAQTPAFGRVTNGRFKGGFITRGFGRPARGVHALQMELACRSYMDEPAGPLREGQWPTAWNAATAAPMRAVLEAVLRGCLGFAQQS